MKKTSIYLVIFLSSFISATSALAECVPCDSFDALCGLDCACTTSTGGCGYETGGTDPGLNCTSPYIVNSTNTVCICGNDNCCQSHFGAGAIYNGNDTDGCTCAEGATWNGSQCVWDACGGDYIKHSNGTCICGGDSCCQRIFGEGAIFDGNGTDGCTCAEGATWNGSQCAFNDEVVYSASFFDTDTPVIANGQSQANIQVTLKSKNNNTIVPANFSIDYSTTSKKGSVSLTMTEGNTYYLTYTSPDLRGTGTTSGKDVLYIHYNNLIDGSAQYKTFDIPLTAGVDVRVSKAGFKDATGNIVFGSSTAKVKVVAGASRTPVKGAKVFLPNDIIGKTTDASGFAYLDGQGSGASDIENVIVLSLSDEISALRSEGQQKYRSIGIKRRNVYNFITNIDNLIAQEASDDGVQKLKNGLRRTVYALFFIQEAQETGHDTSSELADSLDGALSDLNDLFDITGKITDKILGKAGDYVNKNIDTSAVTSLKNSLDNKLKSIGQTIFKKALRVFRRGVAEFARDFPQSWLSSTFDDIKSSVFDDNIYKPIGSAVDIKSIVKNTLKKKVDGKMYQLMGIIEQRIQAKNWGTGNIDSDLSRAKQNYVNLMDNYLTAHSVNYDITVQKAAAESILNAAGDTIGLIPAYGKYVEGVETAYKAIRSAYLNNRQIYYWFDITGKVMTETEKNVKYAVGGYTASILTEGVTASIADVSDDQYQKLMQYEDAQIDSELYAQLLDIAQTMQDINPDDTEVDSVINDLQNKKSTADSEANSLKNEIGSGTISDYENALQSVDYDFEYDTNIPVSTTGDSCFSDTSGNSYETAICYVKDRGIVEGYSDGTYKPDQPINRAEFTKIIMAATYADNQIAGSSCFGDVGNEWFAPYVCAARNMTIVNGNPDGTFRPANNINLAESLKIILESAAREAGISIPNASGQWYQKYFNMANQINLIDTINQEPGHSLTRGEMAEIVYRAENN